MNNQQLPGVLIIDALSLLYRSHHRILLGLQKSGSGRPLYADKVTEDTGRAIARLQKRFGVSDAQTILVFECVNSGEQRRAFWPGYKAGRTARPAEVIRACGYLKIYCAARDTHAIEVGTWEADDVIATIIRACDERGERSVTISSDHDLRQCLSKFASVADPRTIESRPVYRHSDFYVEYGFEPEWFPFYKALLGDASDNLTKVPRLGRKLAGDLVKEYEHAAAMYDHFATRPGPTWLPMTKRDTLVGYAAVVRRNEHLATLVRDVPGVMAQLDKEMTHVQG